MEISNIATPVGTLVLTTSGKTLVKSHWESAFLPEKISRNILNIASQVHDFFENPHINFDYNAKIIGTEFQLKVWELISNIPVGETRTYSSISRELSSSAQAVGNACRANLLPLFVPCHRVVSINSIGGFMGEISGSAINIKSALLSYESEYKYV